MCKDSEDALVISIRDGKYWSTPIPPRTMVFRLPTSKITVLIFIGKKLIMDYWKWGKTKQMIRILASKCKRPFLFTLISCRCEAEQLKPSSFSLVSVYYKDFNNLEKCVDSYSFLRRFISIKRLLSRKLYLWPSLPVKGPSQKGFQKASVNHLFPTPFVVVTNHSTLYISLKHKIQVGDS